MVGNFYEYNSEKLILTIKPRISGQRSEHMLSSLVLTLKLAGRDSPTTKIWDTYPQSLFYYVHDLQCVQDIGSCVPVERLIFVSPRRYSRLHNSHKVSGKNNGREGKSSPFRDGDMLSKYLKLFSLTRQQIQLLLIIGFAIERPKT